MADKKEDEPIQLSTNDIVGAIKQMHWEFGAYMNQPVYGIDPEIMMGILQRMAHFTTMIPLRQQPTQQTETRGEARAN